MTRKMTTVAQERSFGRGVGGALVLLAAFSAWRGRMPLAEISGGIGVLLLVLGTLAPGSLKWPSKGWWTLAHALGWVNTRLLLTIFWAVVIVPFGIVFKLTGRDLLDLNRRGSSWVPYAQRRDPKHFERMY